jgi:hypothetical protein
MWHTWHVLSPYHCASYRPNFTSDMATTTFLWSSHVDLCTAICHLHMQLADCVQQPSLQGSAAVRADTPSSAPLPEAAPAKDVRPRSLGQAVLNRVVSQQQVCTGTSITDLSDVDIPDLGHCQGVCDARLDRLAGRSWVSVACGVCTEKAALRPIQLTCTAVQTSS